jgi:zinc transporter, ZIP family
MTFASTTLLGAIAGFTIYLGLPVARVRRIDARMRVGLAMLSLGILAFIFMDVTSHGMEIVESALTSFKDHKSGFGHVLGLFALLAVGFKLGTAGIALFAQKLRRRGRLTQMPIAGGEAATATASAEELAAAQRTETTARDLALRTGMTIAAAIGLHNFAEGLAIGVSAKAGETALATVLIIGFALHNATEGFGIVGPLGAIQPSWGWLGTVGLVGGGPTLLGTMVGYQVHSDALELCFYGLAGGALLYIIGEIWIGTRRHGHRTLGLFLLAAGFLLGVATDLVVAYGGG